MSELLALLAPPCVGALIGYVTNKVAIRMLFRPLRPWHLCGWRLPFTPGIIPAKRHALALRIGEMVGARLLTAESISRAIAAEIFQYGGYEINLLDTPGHEDFSEDTYCVLTAMDSALGSNGAADHLLQAVNVIHAALKRLYYEFSVIRIIFSLMRSPNWR